VKSNISSILLVEQRTYYDAVRVTFSFGLAELEQNRPLMYEHTVMDRIQVAQDGFHWLILVNVLLILAA
jgi:hypothetical protein